MSPKARLTVNALSIDVEDWFQVQALASHIDRRDWDHLDRRVERNTDRLLDLFARARARATFFTLGWVAERHPDLVRRIVAGGHEVASHGHGHGRVDEIGHDAFRADIRRAKATLEDATGQRVRGYRAPTFSIGPRTPWFYRILEEEGHVYSSSLCPIAHDQYGTPTAPRFLHRPDPQAAVCEVPVTTVRLYGHNLPCGGGGWFRLLPYRTTRWALRRVNRLDRRPAVFYLHPWEIDPDQPRPQGLPARTRLRHTLNLDRTEARLCRLLADFTWDRLDTVFRDS